MDESKKEEKIVSNQNQLCSILICKYHCLTIKVKVFREDHLILKLFVTGNDIPSEYP